nr:uncharacterized protein LOC109193611 [Ipomoea batatas]
MLFVKYHPQRFKQQLQNIGIRLQAGYAKHNQHMTNANREKRGFTNDPTCKAYGYFNEDMEHIIRTCPMAHRVWEILLPQDHYRTRNQEYRSWLNEGLYNGRKVENVVDNILLACKSEAAKLNDWKLECIRLEQNRAARQTFLHVKQRIWTKGLAYYNPPLLRF